MRIDKSVRDDYAILTLKGEFDTFYCPGFQEEVEGLIERGDVFVILNCRHVKFINSTAIGAIIKVAKRAKAEGGEVVISNPSPFVRKVIGTLGIDQVVTVFDDEAVAEKHVVKLLNERELTGDAPVDEEKVLVRFPDETRNQLLGSRPGKHKVLVGTMLSLDGDKLRFSWSGEKQGLSQDQAKQLFFAGSEVGLRFQVKLLKKGHFDIAAKVADVAEDADGQVKVTCNYEHISDADRDALQQFAADMEFLKRQLPGS